MFSNKPCSAEKNVQRKSSFAGCEFSSSLATIEYQSQSILTQRCPAASICFERIKHITYVYIYVCRDPTYANTGFRGVPRTKVNRGSSVLSILSPKPTGWSLGLLGQDSQRGRLKTVHQHSLRTDVPVCGVELELMAKLQGHAGIGPG